MLHQVFLLTFLFFPPLFNLSVPIIYIYCLGTIVQKFAQAYTSELLHIPNNFFPLIDNIVKILNAYSASNAPCKRKNNHIAITYNNPNLSLQPFNVTNEQKSLTWMEMKSWHSVRVVQKITSIGYICLLLVNQKKKLKCVFGCILKFTWQYYS